MQKVWMVLGAVLAWAMPMLAATHEGVQLWENGPLWAKANVGANSPTETGYYFWWGDTLGYKRQNNQWVASDGSKSGFSFAAANVSTYGKTLAQLQSVGAVGADGNLLPAYDAAAKQWGDDWRVPKASEYRNLIELCTWNWTTNNSVAGYSVTGKGLYSGNSIFIPVCGYGSSTNISSGNLTAIYQWTSSSDGTSSGRPCFTSTSRAVGFNTARTNGFTIRPVKSLIATKQASAAALDTRTGTREVKGTESIAYDVAWGGASSGTLAVNGAAVSGLSSKGTYTWTPNTSATNFWKLTYKAGTANYAASFVSLTKYAITYANTKGAANTNPTQYNYNNSITFAALPNVTGYVFNGWNPTKIAAGGFGAKTVTAQWTPITFTVKFNANGGTGSMANESFTYDTAKALTANAFTRTGYTFKGWATSSGATSAAYTDKQSVKNLTATSGATVNLYAVWQVNTYSVKFNANGGSGSMTALGCTYGQNATLTANAFTRTGYAFLGWATSASGAVVYKNGVSVKNLSSAANATVNLYAKWTDTWYVNASTGNDANEGASAADPFKTIQHAIDLTVPGMTIVVADGTYAPIDSGNKSITIRSVNGAAKTIIDGGKAAMCARLSNWSATDSMTNTVLRGFTLQNGYSSLDAGGVQGGTLHDCHVVSNRAARSGGGTCYSALYDCLVVSNQAVRSGGGTCYSVLNNCRIEGNSCGYQGGGSYLPTAFDCTFVGNSCVTNGAGVCSGVLVDCTVISNHTERNGGGAYNAVLTNCVVRDNVAMSNGGGAYSGSLYGCTITNNIAYQNGGGVYGAMIDKCAIAGNEAYVSGGGASYSTVYESELRGNKATQSGGGCHYGNVYRSMITGNEAGEGGGGSAFANIDNSIVTENKAVRGGGCYKGTQNNCVIYANTGTVGAGGTFSYNDGQCTNNNCIVFGNMAPGQKDIHNYVIVHNCYTNDPHFIRAEAGDFRLRCDSPCIDAGNKTYVTNTVDFAGNPRVVNNKVDIGAYEFSAALDRHFTVQVANGTGGAIYYEGDTVTIAAEDRSPRYTFTRWTGDVSVLKNVNSMTNTFTMSTRNLVFTAEYDDLQQYLVIDLSGGVNATSYPVSYLTDVPAGGWTDTYKTTKLVMRRIDPGTFTMGSPEGEAGRRTNETPHQVTLTHPYYIGVFELTQRQWELVMGNRPSAFSNSVCYATRPVESVSFNQIRGTDLGKWWPQMNTVDETSFMGKLRAKTGRLFDLPTEAQWEYACRAGTTTALNSGKNLVAASGVDANMAEVGRYYYNSGAYNNSYDYNGTDATGTAKVGSYLPNAWGIYDMHGNVGEYCIDWYLAGSLVTMTDPIGPETSTQRSIRSGSWSHSASNCRSGMRTLALPSGSVSTYLSGLRPVINFADFSMKKVVNLQASDGTDPNCTRLTWTAVPGAEKYNVYKGATDNFADAVWVDVATANTYQSFTHTTNTAWYWVRAVVDGKLGAVSNGDSGYQVNYALTVMGGSGSTNCLGNTSVTIKANAAPTGYTFKEWTGSTADVALLANKTAATTTLRMPGRAVTLTATCQANAYTVKFNANGGTGTMANEAFVYDTANALTANAFTRTGYTFKGWATSASGAVTHADKASVKNLTATANGTVNLYAVWQANAYTVTFNANGGLGTMANLAMTYDTAKTLTANAFTRTGYTFQGWATSASGAVAHADKASVKNLTATANGTFNLYAVWTANPYTVTFNANGGTGAAMATQDFTYGTAQNLPAVGYARTGYTFLGWSTNPKATAATYADGASVSDLATGGTLKLYAVWRANAYTVHFAPDGASGTMADQAMTFDTAARLTANAFAKDGFGFVGWRAEGNDAICYTNRQQVLNLATNDGAVVTLTAKWTDHWYVDGATGNDANEGTSWDAAFKTIQRAVNAAVSNNTITVADGTYAPINTANKSITIQSVNGAERTIIDGGYPTATNRCVLAGGTGDTNTVIRGFVIQKGCVAKGAGAGVVGGTLYDCVVRSNHGGGDGGGVCRSVMFNCAITNNYTVERGGGSFLGLLTDCVIAANRCGGDGAGAYGGTLKNCILGSNCAENSGGGVSNGSLLGCIVSNNVAGVNGGGTLACQVDCSVILGNGCAVDQEGYGGGAFRGSLQNSLVYGNRIVGSKGNGSGVSVAVCRNCTISGNTGGTLGVHAWLVNDQPGGTNYNCIVYGNTGTTQIDTRMASINCFTRNPMFVDAENGDFRLQGASPCVDAGNNRYVEGETDIRGNARVQNGVVDIGAYEFTLPTALGDVPVAGTDAAVPVEWLGMYGYVDEDSTAADLQEALTQVGDNGVSIWENWVAGLDPWNPDSSLMAGIEVQGDEIEVTWTPDLSNAEPKRHYTVMGKTNLTDAAWVIPVNEEHRFFKVKVTMGEPGLAKEVTATAGASDKDVSISWRAVDQAVGYNVYRGTVDDFDRATRIAFVTDTAYEDATAVPGTQYRYWIVSVANGGEWQVSESVTGYRSIGVPKRVAASDGTSADWITVTWNEVEGAVSYRVLRATTESVEDAVAVGTSAGASWMDRTAASGVTYRYWVVAVGAGIESEPSASDSGYLRLAAPSGVTASNGTYADRVRVTWEDVEGATHYRVYRSASASGTKTAVGDWQSLRVFSDATAEPGVTYYYFVVSAADAEGLSASGYSAGVVGSVKIAAPTGVYATDGTSATGVTVSWYDVTGADGYAVYRGTSGDADAAQILATTAGTRIDDTTALPGTLYYYWVAATNAVSASEKSDYEVGFRSLAAPTGVAATTTSGAAAVTITWIPVEGAVSYTIYRATRNNSDSAVELDTTTGASYVDESAASGRTYYYWVKSVGASCESELSAAAAGSR